MTDRCSQCAHFSGNHELGRCLVPGCHCRLAGELAKPPPFQAHSETSRSAAERVSAPRRQLRIELLDYLRSRGATGATDEELQVGIPMPANTERPRRVECMDEGLVIDSRKKRKGSSGRKAVVWLLTQRGESTLLAMEGA